MAKACPQRASPTCCMRCSNAATASASKGNNQKQADFLGHALAHLDPARVNLHMVQSVLALPSIWTCSSAASPRLDFSFSGPQARAWRGWPRPAS
jgi:hypothetical protein